MKILGYHLVADYVLQPGSDILNDLEALKQLLKEACEVGKFSLFKVLVHKFDPYGLSIIGIIGESHFSFHTWPEHNFLALDIFSCINEEGLTAAQNYLEGKLPIQWRKARIIKRGFDQG